MDTTGGEGARRLLQALHLWPREPLRIGPQISILIYNNLPPPQK
jgi:hypothetical protein